MNTQLTAKLIEKGVIRINTEIDAYYTGFDIAGVAAAPTPGNFTIVGARKKAQSFIFEVRNTTDGSRRTVMAEDVQMIDGMEPDRFAEIYGLTPEGQEVKQGKRRGRKPKNQKAEA